MEELQKELKVMKTQRIIAAIITILLGIMFIVLPTDSGNAVCTILGIALLVGAVVALTAFFTSGVIIGRVSFVMGIILLLAGILCLAKPDLVMGILTVIFGIYIVMDGSASIAQSIECAKVKVDGWFFMLILSIIMVILGVLVIFGPFDTIMVFAGCSLIYVGCADLILTCCFAKKIKETRKRVEEIKRNMNAINQDSNQ